jgi:hypothetical protein
MSIWYGFCSNDIAERIAKALKVIIEANGGKASPF